MNIYYIAAIAGFIGAVIAVLILAAIGYVLWRLDGCPVPCTEFDYEEEASKHDDLKSGKFTEYEGE